mmetsp:Transcript_8148/g.50463  ORF Transcript_8148/g.50463 Transcript_8148/m.50463 type:complete len:110 (+) Transcript_8148:880-1209(+)
MFGTEDSSLCILARLFLSMVYTWKWEVPGPFLGGNESWTPSFLEEVSIQHTEGCTRQPAPAKGSTLPFCQSVFWVATALECAYVAPLMHLTRGARTSRDKEAGLQPRTF